MAHVKFSKKERIDYHRRRYLDFFDKSNTEAELRKNYTPKIQYSKAFLDGVFDHPVKGVRFRPAERFGYWRGQRARKHKDTDLW